jgi:hypothetical protein
MVVAPLGLLLIALLQRWQPSDSRADSVCLFRRCTGVACPSCGMTRALAQLAKGSLEGTVRYHPLAPLMAAELVFLILLWAGTFDARLKDRIARWAYPIVLTNLAILLLVWVGRLATGTLLPA